MIHLTIPPALSSQALLLSRINAVSLLPKSVGYLTLQSAHPLDPPLFYPGYFQHPDDLIMIRDAGRYVKRIVEAQVSRWKTLLSSM